MPDWKSMLRIASTAVERLSRAGTKVEGQDALYFDRNAIEDRRFEDPLARRIHSRASKSEMAAGGYRFDNKPLFRDSNFHPDHPCRVQLTSARRVDRIEFGYGAALQHAF